ncbi:hypothetical protein CCP3SC1_330008 [Gammaproteobacteria bacterium]
MADHGTIALSTNDTNGARIIVAGIPTFGNVYQIKAIYLTRDTRSLIHCSRADAQCGRAGTVKFDRLVLALLGGIFYYDAAIH